MTLLAVLFYLFISVGVFNLIHFALYLIGANIYDVLAFRKRYKLRKSKEESTYKPLVSVLISAYNEELVIERTLRSIWASSYENVEIIVANDGSKDRTSERVHAFIKSLERSYLPVSAKVVRSDNGYERVWKRRSHSVFRKTLLIEKSNGGKASGLNTAIEHAHGDLVMTIDADCLLHVDAIKNAVKYFEDPKVAGVAANVRIMEERTVLGILQRFEHIVAYRSKKFYSIANCELIIGGVASTYRRTVLDAVGHYDEDTLTEDIGLSIKIAFNGNKAYRLVYGADVAAMTEGVSGFGTLLKQRYRWKLGNLQNIVKYRSLFFSRDKKYSKSLSWYRFPMAYFGEVMLFLEPITLGYVVYLSIRFATFGILLGAYITITAYLLAIIWPDEHLTFLGKLKASLTAPFLYFIFYIMNIVQLVSAIHCIINRKSIFNPRSSTWVSPARKGSVEATFS